MTLGLLACALPGCGGDDAATTAIKQVASHLGKIHSGRMDFRFILAPHAQASQGTVGVELAGPFSASKGGALPQLQISYTRLAGHQRTKAEIVSTGRTAYVVANGRTTPLSPAQAAPLRGSLTTSGGLGGLGVDPSRWVSKPKLSAGPTVDGAKTDRITGMLNAGAALRDFAGVARRSGGSVSDREVKRLDGAISSSAVRVIAGHDDHLLRELYVTVALRLPPGLRSRIPTAGGIDATVLMRITHANAPIHVQAPIGSR